jgi:orotate phosphoribosyltransferase
MIFSYGCESNFCYIPLHLPVVLASDDKNFRTNFLSDKCLARVAVFMLESEYTNFVVDLQYIKGIPSRAFSRLNAVSNQGKNIVLVNVSPKFAAEIIAAWSGAGESAVVKNAVGQRQGIEFFDSTFSSADDLFEQIRACKIFKIQSYLRDTSGRGGFYLPSSNVWSNTYVDVKKIFINQEIFSLVLYEMACLIERNIGDKFDELICVSNNGLAIASVLSCLLKKKVIYLMKLGPQSTLMAKDVVKNLGSGKRYVFIYDFSCLGTEIKMVNTIVSLFGSELIGSVGVAKFLERQDFSAKNFSIVKLNEGVPFDYRLFFTKEEVGRA